MSDFNMASLLEGTLEDLADAPSFEPFKPGAHLITIQSWEGLDGKLKISNHPAIKINLRLDETKELNDPNDTAQAPGSETGIVFMMDNEYGQGSLKKILAALSSHFGSKTNGETFEASTGAQCLAITDLQSNKEKTKFYTNIKEISVI